MKQLHASPLSQFSTQFGFGGREDEDKKRQENGQT